MFKLSVLSALLAVGVLTVFKGNKPPAPQTRPKLRAEFHQSYPVAPGARVSIRNVVGAVRVSAWERNEVRVDALKTADTQQILDDAEIKIEAASGDIEIVTRYPEDTNNLPAEVEYTLTVPRNLSALVASVDTAPLHIEGVPCDITASTINGELVVRGIAGQARLSTHNGRLLAAFERLSAAKPASLKTVNGHIELTLPPEAAAEIRADSLHGPIKNDFGLREQRGEFSGSSLSGSIGRGGPRITLSNDYGGITIRRPAATQGGR